MDENIKIKLFDSITSNEIESISSDFIEIGLDSLFEDGLFKDIPVVNTLISLSKLGIELRHQFFFKKICIFLKELSEISLEKRESFLAEIKSTPWKKSEFEETLLLIIEQLDSIHKPRILGRLLKNHILGNISYEDTTRLSFILHRVYTNDLKYLLQFQPGIQPDPDIAASLQSFGLLSNTGMDGGTFDEPFSGDFLYELNRYGEMLLKYGLKESL